MKKVLILAAVLAAGLPLTACYTPGDRAAGGAVIWRPGRRRHWGARLWRPRWRHVGWRGHWRRERSSDRRGDSPPPPPPPPPPACARWGWDPYGQRVCVAFYNYYSPTHSLGQAKRDIASFDHSRAFGSD